MKLSCQLKSVFTFNVAVGSNRPDPPGKSTEFPQSTLVDYIHVFQ